MSEVKKIFITNENVKLEAEYFENINDKECGILFTHPHPEFGGNMHNNVVSGIFNALIANDISCLRFNFIGVGKSKNISSAKMNPISQVELCIDYLLNRDKIKKILICGYSYGAAVGCSAINYNDDIIGYIAISFPWDFMGKNFKKLSQSDKTKLFIQGDRDDIAVYNNFKNHYSFYHDPKTFEIIKGADHFYWGYENKLATLVISFYNTQKSN
jgi:hypothetical protein